MHTHTPGPSDRYWNRLWTVHTYLLLHHHTLYLTIHSGLTSSVFYITTLFTSLYTVTLHSLSSTSHYTDVYMYDSYCTLLVYTLDSNLCVCVCVLGSKSPIQWLYEPFKFNCWEQWSGKAGVYGWHVHMTLANITPTHNTIRSSIILSHVSPKQVFHAPDTKYCRWLSKPKTTKSHATLHRHTAHFYCMKRGFTCMVMTGPCNKVTRASITCNVSHGCTVALCIIALTSSHNQLRSCTRTFTYTHTHTRTHTLIM